MHIFALLQAILTAAPQELELVEALIQIAKGTHAVVPVTPPVPVLNTAQTQANLGNTIASQTETAAPVVSATETAAPVVPPNGKKVTL